MVSKLCKLLSILSVLKRLATPLFLLTGCFLVVSLTGCKDQLTNGLLNPKGIIAYQERKLFFDTLALMLIVVLPVIIMSFAFVYHYQISHRTRDYKPNWAHSYLLESIWWLIPCVIIFILAVMTWKKTHELDPFNKIAGYQQKPLVIQVIALPWKWLFIYPEQNIATVNYLEIPAGQPVEYWLTADNVPMSAFFVPQLGSQIYTLAGTRTRLNMVANVTGTYQGLNTQFNGDGFSDMHFQVHVVSPAEMTQWVEEVKKSPDALTEAAYNELVNPSIDDKVKLFASVAPDQFESVVHTYMSSMGPVHPRDNPFKLPKE